MRRYWFASFMVLCGTAHADDAADRWFVTLNALLFEDDVPRWSTVHAFEGEQVISRQLGLSAAYVDPRWHIGGRLDVARVEGIDEDPIVFPYDTTHPGYKSASLNLGVALVAAPWRIQQSASGTTDALLEAGLWYRSFEIRIACGIPSGSLGQHCIYDGHAWSPRASVGARHTLSKFTVAMLGGIAFTDTLWHEGNPPPYNCASCTGSSYTFIGELRVGAAW